MLLVGKMKRQIIAAILEAAETTDIVPQIVGVLKENVNFIKDVVEMAADQPVRTEKFYEKIIPEYSLDDFKIHFRMSRNQVEVKLKIKCFEKLLILIFLETYGRRGFCRLKTTQNTTRETTFIHNLVSCPQFCLQ